MLFLSVVLLLLQQCVCVPSREDIRTCLETKITEHIAHSQCKDLKNRTRSWLEQRFQNERLGESPEERTGAVSYEVLDETEILGRREVVTTKRPLVVFGLYPDMLCGDWVREFGTASGRALGGEFGCAVDRVRGRVWAAACSFRNYHLLSV